MLHNYIKTNEIVKATPSGYIITELRSPIGFWTTYETSQFTNRGIFDFKIVNSPRTITNLFDTFIQNKSSDAKNGILDVPHSLNIESVWDKRFPETIRLKYPGVITNNNFSERKKFKKEENYTFKVWENRSSLSLDNAKTMPFESIPSITQQDYFYDLLSFIKLDGDVSYEDWLKRPLFSLKTLLSKGVQKDKKMYQLYKVNDVNVQSLSNDFDEYIPWCFDQNGSKIEQYKIATITSFNKKEIYILLELRQSDMKIKTVGEISTVEIPIIKNIVFWRSGMLDNSITMDIRNKDQKLLVKDNEVSNISDYFRETDVDTNTLVSFQKNRLENEFLDETPVDNNNTLSNAYEFKSNKDSYFAEVKAKDILKQFISGRKSDTSLNISIGNKLFRDHSKNKVHIFVDGNLLTYNDFYILNGNIIATLPTATSYVEIYINQYNEVEYSFMLTANAQPSAITQNELSYILYNSGFLWKTTQDKEYLLFNKNSNDCKFVDGTLVTNGNYLVIYGLFFDLNDDQTAIPTGTVLATNENVADVSDAREHNINYDPILFRTSANDGNNPISNKDVWLFDNTKELIKTSENEPFIKIDSGKIKVMDFVDKNIQLSTDTDIVSLKNALTPNITSQGTIHEEIISESEKNYLVEHYSQMSIVNKNILNMFLYSNPTSWTSLPANTQVKLNKDYMIVRYTNTDGFPLLSIHKPNSYTYNTIFNSIDVKVKPSKVTFDYYVLHRTNNAFTDLYNYSFNKDVSYIII